MQTGGNTRGEGDARPQAVPAASGADRDPRSQGLRALLAVPWLRLLEFGDLLETGGDLGAVVVPWTESSELTASPGTWLVVFDLASDDEAKHIAAAGTDVPPVARKKGRLYGLLAERILGGSTGFWLKAVDTRKRMTIDTTASAPGVLERKITELPACFALKE